MSEVMLSVVDARDLTDRIKRASDDLAGLLREAKEGRAWEVLSYVDWAEYVKEEFGLGRRHADEMVNVAVVREALPNGGTPPLSNRTLTPFGALLPDQKSLDRTNPEAMAEAKAKVAEAFEVVKQRHAEEYENGEPPPLTREEVRSHLRKANLIPERKSEMSSHPPGWFELLGDSADSLVLAGKKLAKVEAAVNRSPNQKFRDKCEQYATMAAELADRYRALAER